MLYLAEYFGQGAASVSLQETTLNAEDLTVTLK